MHYDVIIYVLIIDYLAIMSPGPDFFMVLKNSLTQSHKAGFYVTLGISVGSVLVYTLGIFGIGALVAESKPLFMLVKVAGGSYLAYLGLRAITAKTSVHEPQLTENSTIKNTMRESFWIGLWCNLTNPKAFLFIVSLSTYIAKNGNPYTDGVVVIIGSFIGTMIWFCLVSVIFGSIRVRRVFYQRQRSINIVLGLILLYVASQIIFL